MTQSGKILPFVLAVLLQGMALSPAFAQYSPWGYSPLTGSNNFLWLSRSLFSPTRMFSGSYAYNAPYYLANNLLWGAASTVGRGINNRGKKQAAKQFWTNPANGVNAPVVDQISAAPWYKPVENSANNFVLPQSPMAVEPIALDTKDPAFMPVPSSLDESSKSPAKEEKLPQTAPDFRSLNPSPSDGASAKSSNGIQAEGIAPAQAANPLTQAFIDHVNSKYGGDICRALADKQTRAYAQALGVIEIGVGKSFELPADRIELIKRILNDPLEDSLTKVNTIRLLLRH